MKEKLKNILRASERYTKTDMVYLARGGFWLTLDRVLSSLSTLLLAVAFANLFVPEDYGTYKFVLSIVGILALSTLPGINTALTKAVSQGREASLLPATRARIKWGVWGTFGAILVASYYFINGNIELALLFLASAVFVPFYESFNTYQSFLEGKKKFDTAAKYLALNQTFVSTVIIGALLFYPSLVIVFLVYFVAWSTSRAFFFLRTLRHVQNNSTDPGLVYYAKHLSFIKGLGVAAGNLGNILLFHFLGAGPLAVFTLAMAPIEQVRSYIKPAETLMLPKIADESWKAWSLGQFFKKLSPFLLVLAIGIAIYIFTAPWLYGLLFPQYDDSISFSQVLSVSLILTAINVAQVSILRARERIRELHILNIFSTLATLLSLIVLVPVFKIWGYVASIFFVKIVELVTMAYLLFLRRVKTAKKVV